VNASRSLVDAFADFVGEVGHRTVTLPWGDCAVWELGSGPPLVLLHGITGSRRIFFRVAPLLAREYRVIVPFLRGEDVPAPRATLDDLLGDLAALLGGMQLANATLCGVSFGGALALAYGGRNDPRVARLIVQGGFAQFRLRRPDRIALAVSGLVPAGLGSLYLKRRVLHGPEIGLLREHAPGLERLVPEWSARTPFSTLRRRVRLIAGHDVSDRVRRIQAPLTLAHGSRDRVVPRLYQERLAALRPDARRVVWDGVGHLAPLTHPDLFIRLF